MKTTLITLCLMLAPYFLLAQTIDTTAFGQKINGLLYHSMDLAGQQKIDEAFAIVEQAKDSVTSTLSQDHPFYAVCLSYQAKLHENLGQFKEAENLFLKADGHL